MPRYIDTDVLFELGHYDDFNEYVIDWKTIDNAPIADVRENVHGRWIKRSNGSALRPYMCSNCGCSHDVDTVMGKIVWNYCPNCGAKMECE